VNVEGLIEDMYGRIIKLLWRKVNYENLTKYEESSWSMVNYDKSTKYEEFLHGEL